jgi:hypothetical protein
MCAARFRKAEAIATANETLPPTARVCTKFRLCSIYPAKFAKKSPDLN